MKKIIFIIVSISVLIPISAKKLEKAIGMSAGYLSGSGFSYRVMETKFGYQFTSGVFFSQKEENLKYSDKKFYDIYSAFNLGSNFYYNFLNKGTSRFYFLSGISLFYINERYQKEKTVTYYWEIIEDKNFFINAGIGIGLEFPLTKHFHFSIEWPWYFDSKANFVKFIPQAGYHYYF